MAFQHTRSCFERFTLSLLLKVPIFCKQKKQKIGISKYLNFKIQLRREILEKFTSSTTYHHLTLLVNAPIISTRSAIRKAAIATTVT